MIRFIKMFIPCVFLLLLIYAIISFVVWELNNCVVMSSDYFTCMTIDEYEKIPASISNVMHKVTSKGFILSKVSIECNYNKKTYTICCGGIDEAKFTKNEKTLH